jgi:hypothetical protein
MSNSTSTSDANGFFPYDPSEIGALIAAGLFGATAVIHVVMMVRKKTWFYTAMVIGAFSAFPPHHPSMNKLTKATVMTCGYVARYIAARNPTNLPIYVAQVLLLLLPPSLYAATIYMIYGRIVLFVNAPNASIIRPTWVTKIFVTGDVFSFLIQAAGGSMISQAGHQKLGKNVVLTGLFCQLLFFGFFLTIAIIFYLRMAKSSIRYVIPKYGKHSWRSLLVLLLVAAVVIIVRCVYRIINFSGSAMGYLMTHEVFMYIGDTVPMFAVQTMFLFIHAGDVFAKGGMAKDESSDESYIPLNGV